MAGKSFLSAGASPQNNFRLSKAGTHVGPNTHKGAVAIEFALIFSILFGLFYAIVSYALPLMMMQTFHSAAADGARAAITVTRECEDGECNSVCGSEYNERVECEAEAVANKRIEWLIPLSNDQLDVDAVFNGETLDITVQYPNYMNNPPIPVLTLPFIGDIPRLPDTLSGSASVRL